VRSHGGPWERSKIVRSGSKGTAAEGGHFADHRTNMIAKRVCPACRRSLSVAAFNGSAKASDRLSHICRACTNARRRQLNRSRKGRLGPATRTAALAAALRQGDIDMVRRLLAAGLKPDWSWVCETMRGGHIALAELLLNSGIRRNVFTMAAMGDVVRLERRLCKVPAGARLTASMEPASQGVTALHVACASDWWSHGQGRMADQLRVAQALAQHGAELSAVARYRGIEGATPLLCACWSSRNLSLVRWLLDEGAIAMDGHLLAALGHLQRHGKEAYDIAEALLAWGVPVDGDAVGGRTPLQAFAHQGTHKTVSWLLAHGANANARLPGGRTAAHLAAERNIAPTTLAVLAENGADLAAVDEDGHTPLDIAKLYGKSQLVDWISSRVRANRR
jgi:ankyrin repeat protein